MAGEAGGGRSASAAVRPFPTPPLAPQCIPISLAADAVLAQHGALTAAAFIQGPGSDPSPQAEVIVAALATLAAWRGIYVGLGL